MATIKTGWLKNRNGETFAPKTLSDLVVNEDGVRLTDSIQQKLNEITESINEDIIEKLKNFGGEDSDEFYIMDSNGNLIFKVDSKGTTSVDFITPEGSLNNEIKLLKSAISEEQTERINDTNTLAEEVALLKERTANIEGGDADEFYIMDSNGHIIFKVDSNGATSVDFITPNGSLSDEVETLKNIVSAEQSDRVDAVTNLTNRINSLDERTANIEGGDSSDFYISDANGNIIFKVDENGTTSVNFVTPEGDLNAVLAQANDLSSSLELEIKERQTAQSEIQTDVAKLQTNLQTEIDNRTEADTALNQEITKLQDADSSLQVNINAESQSRQEAISALTDDITNIHNQIQYIEGGEADNFYISDVSGNMIFKVDEEGATSVNFVTPEGDLNALIADEAQARADLEAEITARKASDSTFTSGISDLNAKLSEEITDRSNTDIKLNTLIGDDTDKSVRTIANEELAVQLIPENAQESLGTLQEIAAWIQSHPDDVATMNVAIASKMDKENPTGSGTFSFNRKADSQIGENSIAIGYDAVASGYHAVSMGGNASGDGSFAESVGTASGFCSHAEGTSVASGSISHAEGFGSEAKGAQSHAEGSMTKAVGNRSHTEGEGTIANGEYQHAQGKYNIADETSAYIVGNGSGSSKEGNYYSNAHTLDWDGNAWFAGDVYTGSTSGTNKDEGSLKLATESYVDTSISNLDKISVGLGNIDNTSDADKPISDATQEALDEKMNMFNPVGEGSFSFGREKNSTIGENSIAMGYNTIASGVCSFAEGVASSARGEGSHAEGHYTIASSICQHAEGRYNIEDTENKYLHIVGNGSATLDDNSNTIENRSNAYTLDWDGNGWYAGGLTVTNTLAANTVEGAVWNDYAEYREVPNAVQPGRVVQEQGDDTLALADGRLLPGCNIVTDTFGFSIGETERAQAPIAVAGRVLAYPYEDKNSYAPGDAVCSGPNGTISKMSREEIREFPERIVGTVSAIPNYEIWGSNNIAVDGRIWIKIK